jgi:hypothetical protein
MSDESDRELIHEQDRPWNWGDWRPCAEHPKAQHELQCFECRGIDADETTWACDACITTSHCWHHGRCLAECWPADLVSGTVESK